MFGEDLKSLMQFDYRELTLVSRITEHHARPPALRLIDQIRMHHGSELLQAKIIADYLRGREVVFLGDADCMCLVLAMLAKEDIIEAPKYMRVLDFDQRLLRFIRDVSKQYQFSSMIEVHEPHYNVRDPIPEKYAGQSEVFYTNPPYGSKNKGESAKIFLARCMELCRRERSWGIAILPFQHNLPWSRDVMLEVQSFLGRHGYLVSEMLRALHEYALDDAPWLASCTVVMDRIKYVTPPYQNRRLSDDEMEKFYGEEQKEVPEYIDFDGNAVHADGRCVPLTERKQRRGKRGRR